MGDELLYLLGGIGVVMLIICLVVREGTEGRLARKRTELMSLRNAERGLGPGEQNQRAPDGESAAA